MISIITAIARNRVIGRDNRLAWHLPADLQFFKRTTMGHTLIMGRKTFESFGKPLPGRKSVVVTRQKDFTYPGVEIAHSITEALSLAPADEEIFIIGGAEIYKQALPLVDKLYITRIDGDVEGNVYFPDYETDEWQLISSSHHPADEKNMYSMDFELYTRKKKDS